MTSSEIHEEMRFPLQKKRLSFRPVASVGEDGKVVTGHVLEVI